MDDPKDDTANDRPVAPDEGDVALLEPTPDAADAAEPSAAPSEAEPDAVEAASAGTEAATESATGPESEPEPAATELESAAEPEPPAAEPEPPAAEPAPAAAEPESAAEPEPAFEPESAAEPEPEPAAATAAGDEEPDREPAGEPATAPTVPAAPVTVGRMVADALRRAGVRWAFTVPGESFLGLIDGLEAAGIHVVATRHEGAAAFMAEAHAQLTGRPAACLATRAVGAANLAIGIHTATADSSPMFALVGGVERASRGREGFQEIDLAATIGGLAKWSAEPRDVREAVAAMETAVIEATTGRPGPVVVGLAEDLLDELVPVELAATPPRTAPRRPTDEEVGAALRLLTSGERPVILAGGGILRARTSNELVRLAELLRIPVIAAWRRGDVISNDHPLYLGMTGYGSPAIVRERLATADTMLVIGCRLGEVASYGWSIPAPGTRWAHVDVAPVRPSPALAPADLAIESDAKQFLRAAIARLESRGVLEATSTDARVARNEADRAAWEAAAVVTDHPWSGPGVHPGKVIASLRGLLPDDGIVTTDAGNFGGWAARGFRFRRPGTFLGPTSGAMGYGLPAAIAAGLVHRDRSVVALVGDGGFGMTLAELETAVRMGLRTVVLVFDNEQYGMIRSHQDQRDGGSTAATDLGPIDFAAAARALGARGVRVESDAGVEAAIRQALVADRPTVIQLVVDRRWSGVDAKP
ncbi:MAG TPA: thiamine pyrophosphate-dependent enzyme [Candidatus Limnocylindrales bacterium]|nr:thiamine pyrophosphate-dependent enzyme [Candidatus Limnocylindrales bacterium]